MHTFHFPRYLFSPLFSFRVPIDLMFCLMFLRLSSLSFLVRQKVSMSSLPACFAIAAAGAIALPKLPLLAFLSQLPAALPASGSPLCACLQHTMQLPPSPVLPASTHRVQGAFLPHLKRCKWMLFSHTAMKPVNKD